MRVSLLKWMFTAAFTAVLVGATWTPAAAQAVVTNGTITLGVNAEGHLNYTDGTAPSNSGVWGVSFFTDYEGGGADWRDATSPGCYCEGFGVAVTDAGLTTHSGFANVTVDGVVNLTAGPSVADADSVVTTASITSLAGLTIMHDYHPSGATANLYEATVTITNNTAGAVTDVLYRRVMDWDVPPTEFNEFVTLQGAGAGALVDSCNNGFETADPTVDCRQSGKYSSVSPFFEDVDFADIGPTDHGALFTFDLGGLAVGESKSFNIYYGAAGTEGGALAALGAVGATSIYSLGQSANGSATGTPATFIFAFSGEDIGVPPTVPEPASLLLLGGGLAGVVIRRYRNRA
jgi:type IV pilus assembly protein PilY1